MKAAKKMVDGSERNPGERVLTRVERFH